MQVLLNQGLNEAELATVRVFRTLEDVLLWGFGLPVTERCPSVIADVVVQDEYTHDVLVPWRSRWLIYHAN